MSTFAEVQKGKTEEGDKLLGNGHFAGSAYLILHSVFLLLI